MDTQKSFLLAKQNQKVFQFSIPQAIFTLFSNLHKDKLLQLKLIHIFVRAILLMKKMEIEKTKPTFIRSVLKVEH